MATPNKADSKEEQEKTIGKEAASQQANNGAPTTDDIREEVKATQSEVADLYERARRELNESVNRLRYEMSKFDVDEARQRARTWVEENPTLAVFLALGGGIVAGKLLSSAFRSPPPPTFGEKVRRQSNVVAKQARHLAHDVGEAVSDASGVLVRKAGQASTTAAQRARELGDVVARRAEELAAIAAEQAAELGDTVAERSVRTAHTFQEQAGEVADVARHKAEHGFDMAESAYNAAKTVLAAVVVKKVSDWIRRIA